MGFENKTTAELLQFLRKHEQIDPQDRRGVRKEIRKILFKRGVKNINGTPIDVLLRNPLLRAEYEAVQGEITSEGN